MSRFSVYINDWSSDLAARRSPWLPPLPDNRQNVLVNGNGRVAVHREVPKGIGLTQILEVSYTPISDILHPRVPIGDTQMATVRSGTISLMDEVGSREIPSGSERSQAH